MGGPSDGGREELCRAERKLLAALCQGNLAQQTRAAILQALDHHEFAAVDHRAVFRALEAIPASHGEPLHAALARGVTRLGFPDVAMEELFEMPAPSSAEIESLLKLLARSADE
jgi:hypothetical protein